MFVRYLLKFASSAKYKRAPSDLQIPLWQLGANNVYLLVQGIPCFLLLFLCSIYFKIWINNLINMKKDLKIIIWLSKIDILWKLAKLWTSENFWTEFGILVCTKNLFLVCAKKGFKICDPLSWYPSSTKNHEMWGPPVSSKAKRWTLP